MNRGKNIVRFVGVITIIVILLIILFIGKKVISYVNRPQEITQNTEVKDDGINLSINGDFVTYVSVNEKYIEEGAKAYINDENVSDDIVISYYEDGSQVSVIDTSSFSTYTVKYDVAEGGKTKEVTRVVIVTDNKTPNLKVPTAMTITSD